MEIILLQKIEHLGNLGEVVRVRNGFGRNYLIPYGKALPSTPNNRARFEADRRAYEAKQGQMRQEAEVLASRVSELKVVLQRPAGSNEKLFGSITSSDLAEYFNSRGIAIPRKVIELSQPIKRLGEHEVQLRLHPDVSPKIVVTVERAS